MNLGPGTQRFVSDRTLTLTLSRWEREQVTSAGKLVMLHGMSPPTDMRREVTRLIIRSLHLATRGHYFSLSSRRGGTGVRVRTSTNFPVSAPQVQGQYLAMVPRWTLDRPVTIGP